MILVSRSPRALTPSIARCTSFRWGDDAPHPRFAGDAGEVQRRLPVLPGEVPIRPHGVNQVERAIDIAQ